MFPEFVAAAVIVGGIVFWTWEISRITTARDTPPIDTDTDDPQTVEEARERYAALDEEYTILDYESDLDRILGDEDDSEDDSEPDPGDDRPRAVDPPTAEYPQWFRADREPLESVDRTVEQTRTGHRISHTEYQAEVELGRGTDALEDAMDHCRSGEPMNFGVNHGGHRVYYYNCHVQSVREPPGRSAMVVTFSYERKETSIEPLLNGQTVR